MSKTDADLWKEYHKLVDELKAIDMMERNKKLEIILLKQKIKEFNKWELT